MTTASSEMAFWAAQDSMAIEWPMIPMKATGADAGDDDDDSDGMGVMTMRWRS